MTEIAPNPCEQLSERSSTSRGNTLGNISKSTKLFLAQQDDGMPNNFALHHHIQGTVESNGVTSLMRIFMSRQAQAAAVL